METTVRQTWFGNKTKVGDMLKQYFTFLFKQAGILVTLYN